MGVAGWRMECCRSPGCPPLTDRGYPAGIDTVLEDIYTVKWVIDNIFRDCHK